MNSPEQFWLILGAFGSAFSIVALILIPFPARTVEISTEPEEVKPTQFQATKPPMKELTSLEKDPRISPEPLPPPPSPPPSSNKLLKLPFNLSPGSSIVLDAISTTIRLHVQEKGWGGAEALRLTVIPSSGVPFYRDLIGESGALEFETEGKVFVLTVLGVDEKRNLTLQLTEKTR